jgi:hypothetical protein
MLLVWDNCVLLGSRRSETRRPPRIRSCHRANAGGGLRRALALVYRQPRTQADYVVASCHLGRGAQGGARHPAHVTRQPRGADVGLGLFCGPELADRIGVEVGPCTPPAFSVATTALRGRTVHVVDAGIGSRTADGVEPANPEGHGALAARMEAPK